MSQENQEEDKSTDKSNESKVKVSKAQRGVVLQEVIDEYTRRMDEMRKDIYASRDYSDGVRFEVRRMQEWLSKQMES